MSDWLNNLVSLGFLDRSNNKCLGNYVLVSVIRTQGSCPRDSGTRMLVSDTQCLGTIGGGHLEYQAIDIAREQLKANRFSLRIERFALGARLGQCCGGAVSVSFDTLTSDSASWIAPLVSIRQRGEAAILVTPDSSSGLPSSQKLIVIPERTFGFWPDEAAQQHAERQANRILQHSAHFPTSHRQDSALYETILEDTFTIAVFGAGHVAQALVHVLSPLPCRIHWIESRESQFSEPPTSNITQLINECPEDEVERLPAGCHVVIMTHSHAIDQAICEATLKREHIASCSLIGSNNKRTLFERKLQYRGVSKQALQRLICPIGVPGITGKHPAEIAIAVAAEILQLREAVKINSIINPIETC